MSMDARHQRNNVLISTWALWLRLINCTLRESYENAVRCSHILPSLSQTALSSRFPNFHMLNYFQLFMDATILKKL